MRAARHAPSVLRGDTPPSSLCVVWVCGVGVVWVWCVCGVCGCGVGVVCVGVMSGVCVMCVLCVSDVFVVWVVWVSG